MFTAFAVIYLSTSFEAITNSSGAPAGHSGSPASNGNTCATSCHTGTAIANQDFTITSDIPPTGFLANTSYSFTILANANGNTGARLGFMASVENNGSHVGTLGNYAGGGTQNAGPNYVTHTASTILPSNGQRMWFFSWNSGETPAATLYVAVNFCNGNNAATGDATKAKSVSFQKSNLSIEKLELAELKMYPNPVVSQLNVQFFAHEAGELQINIFDITGAIHQTVFNDFIPTGNFEQKIDWSQLKSGNYLVQLNLNGKQHLQQIFKM